jgi:hypothetical protein
MRRNKQSKLQADGKNDVASGHFSVDCTDDKAMKESS